MPHNTPANSNEKRMCSDAVRLCATILVLVILVGFGVALAHAQGGKKPRGQGAQTTPATTAAAQAQARQKAKLTPLRSSDTSQGSQLTITSTEPLNNYSAYRSGDRFYVLIPNADANAVGGGVRGRGFEDAQVQKRGEDVVLSFRVQPGAKPRVQQRFNKLDVVFAANEGATASVNNAQPSQPNETRNTPTTAPTPQQNVQTATPTNPDQETRTPAVREQSAPVTQPQGTDGAAPPVQDTNALPPSGTQASETPQAAPAGTPAVEQQVAAARPPEGAAAPIKITAEPAAAQPSAAFGAAVLRNWPLALIGTLLLVGLGLFFAARRSAAAKQPTPAPTPQLKETKTAALREVDVQPAPPVRPVEPVAPVTTARVVEKSPEVKVPPAVIATPIVAAQDSARGGKKKKKKDKKRRGGIEAVAPAATPPVEAARIESEEAEAQTLSEAPPAEAQAVEQQPVARQAVEAPVDEVAPVESVASVDTSAAEPVVLAPAVVETHVAETVADETIEHEPVSKVAALPSAPVAVSPAQSVAAGIELAAPVLDPDAVQAETRRLLDGEGYDKNLIAVSDAVTRQMIAAELLAALAGRNADRRERARTAFLEHGYFNETAHDLHNADAPAERASAARSLGLVADRVATTHLLAALEDTSSEVRRAAVEALASVRDPRAVEPLKALREREKRERIKLSRTLIQHAIDVCVEAPREIEPTLAESSAATLAAPEESMRVAEPVAVEATPAEVSRVEVEDVLEARAGEATASKEEVVAAAEEAALEETLLEDTLLVEEPRTIVTSEEIPTVEARAPVVAVEELEETLIVADETPAAVLETIEAPEARAVETHEVEAVRQPVEVESHTPSVEAETELVLEEEVAPTEEKGVDHVMIEPDLEFETYRAEPFVKPSAKPVEGFDSTRDESAAEEWIDLDIRDAEVNYQPYGADVLEKIVPAERAIERSDVSAHALATETEAPPARVPAPERAAAPVVTSPAAEATGPSEGKAIAPFVEDDMSAVPKAIQVRLASEEPEERATAIKDLAHVSGDDAFRVICSGFDDQSVDVRSAAARSLFSLQEDHAEAFTRALREAAPQRRRHIGAAIASSGLAAEALSHLTGESREKTYDAFSLLFLMAKAGEVHPLVKAIEAHQDNEVRLAVVKLLALSGQKEILPTFRRLAVRGSLPQDVRSAVMEAIYQISSQSTPVA